jgi:hypothetical protein
MSQFQVDNSSDDEEENILIVDDNARMHKTESYLGIQHRLSSLSARSSASGRCTTIDSGNWNPTKDSVVGFANSKKNRWGNDNTSSKASPKRSSSESQSTNAGTTSTTALQQSQSSSHVSPVDVSNENNVEEEGSSDFLVMPSRRRSVETSSSHNNTRGHAADEDAASQEFAAPKMPSRRRSVENDSSENFVRKSNKQFPDVLMMPSRVKSDSSGVSEEMRTPSRRFGAEWTSPEDTQELEQSYSLPQVQVPFSNKRGSEDVEASNNEGSEELRMPSRRSSVMSDLSIELSMPSRRSSIEYVSETHFNAHDSLMLIDGPFPPKPSLRVGLQEDAQESSFSHLTLTSPTPKTRNALNRPTRRGVAPTTTQPAGHFEMDDDDEILTRRPPKHTNSFELISTRRYQRRGAIISRALEVTNDNLKSSISNSMDNGSLSELHQSLAAIGEDENSRRRQALAVHLQKKLSYGGSSRKVHDQELLTIHKYGSHDNEKKGREFQAITEAPETVNLDCNSFRRGGFTFDDVQLPALVEDDSIDGSDIDEESDEEEEDVTLKTQQLSSLTKAITDVQTRTETRTVTGPAFDRPSNGSIDQMLKEEDFDEEDESPVTVRTLVTSSGFQTLRTKQSIAH